jgi:hypothetical protein
MIRLFVLGFILAIPSYGEVIVVEGKAPLSLGVIKAREAAINSALVEASYRRSANVSAFTQVDNLVVTSDSNMVTSSTMINSFDVISDYECAPFYCVELNVDVVPVERKAKQFSDLIVDLRVVREGVSTTAQLDFYGMLYGELESYLILDRGIAVSDGLSDYVASVNFVHTPIKKSFWDVFSDTEGNVLASIEVSSGSSKRKGFVKSEEVFFLGQDVPFADVSSFIEKVADGIEDKLKEVPLDGQFYVSNVIGNRVFIQAKSAEVSSLVVATFKDLITGELVRINGFVASVYKFDAIIHLNDVPLSHYRLQSLKRMSGESLSVPVNVLK